MKATHALLILIILLLVSCATNKGVSNNDISKNRDKADREIAKMNEALAGAPAEGKEIIGSAKDGVVLHKDVIRQGAKPGDYLYRQTGEDRGKLVILTQYDIDTSKTELARMGKELLDEKSGSIRSLLDEIIEEEDLEFSGEPTDETEIPYSELSGRVIEYISDIRDRKQIVLITTKKTEEVFFDEKFPVPPWHKVKKENSPVLITFILTKKVTSTENKIFSFNEDIESTKILLKEVKEAPIFLPPSPPPPPPPPPPKPPKPPKTYGDHKHEAFDSLLGIGAGFDLGFDLAQGDVNVGINYDFYVLPWISVSTGLMYGGTLLIPPENYGYQSYASTGSYVTIPLSVHFNIPSFEWLYVGAGVEFSIPINLTYSTPQISLQGIGETASYYTRVPIDIGVDFANLIFDNRAGGRVFFRIITNFHTYDVIDNYYWYYPGYYNKYDYSTKTIHETNITYGLGWQFYNWRISRK